MKRRLKTTQLLAFGLSLALSFLASSAAASKTFPEALRQKLELPKIAGPGMGCQLCHRDDTGGAMTATKPFGRSLIQAGVQGGNVPSLLSALVKLEANGKDSDNDGTSDIAELRAATDPNVADVSGDGGSPCTTTEELPLPETGCSLNGGTTPGSVCAPFGVALYVLVLGRRRRAR